MTHATATLLLLLLGAGGLAGVLAGGRIADAWLAHGNVNGRIIVGAASFGVAAVLFLPGLLTTSVAVAPNTIGAVAVTVRLADALAPAHGRAAACGPPRPGFGAAADAHGLQRAFLALLITLALGGGLTFLATRTYPRDTATALASEAASTPKGETRRRTTRLTRAA